MSGLTDLNSLLLSLSPILNDGEFVFLTRPDGRFGEAAELKPIATFQEPEGMTLIAPKCNAVNAGESFTGVFRMITLQVQSSLEAVGLTAAVAGKLTEKGISANLVAAYHHDHIFVPADRAEDAMTALKELQIEKTTDTHG